MACFATSAAIPPSMERVLATAPAAMRISETSVMSASFWAEGRFWTVSTETRKVRKIVDEKEELEERKLGEETTTNF